MAAGFLIVAMSQGVQIYPQSLAALSISGTLLDSLRTYSIGIVEIGQEVDISYSSNGIIVVGITTTSEMLQWNTSSQNPLSLLSYIAGRSGTLPPFTSHSEQDYSIVITEMAGEKMGLNYSITYQIIRYPVKDTYSQYLNLVSAAGLAISITSFAAILRKYESKEVGQLG
jgi:hypothetical protein